MLKRFLFIGIFGLAVAIGYSSNVAGTDINTEICDSSSGPVINITSPLSDSIVNSSTLHIQGSAVRTTQVDAYLNDSYSSSFAVGSSEQIDTTIALLQGTNTVRLEAYYSCNQTASTTTLIVTYEPAAVPSDGTDTDTDLPSTVNQPGGSGDSPISPPIDPTETPVAEPPDNDSTQQPGTEHFNPDQKKNDDASSDLSPERMPLGVLFAALSTPSLLLFCLERFGSGMWLESRRLSEALKWMIRGSGLLLAGILAILLYGAAIYV